MMWHYLSGNLIIEIVFSAHAYVGSYQRSELQKFIICHMV